MPLWKDPKTGKWRYQFQHLGERKSKTGFNTKTEARAALEEHRKSLKNSKPEPQPLDFLTAATEYLEYCQRRYARKTWKYKAYVYREFMAYCGNPTLEAITIGLLESYLQTRHSNVNYNRHRKDLCALLAWAWRKRGYISHNPCFLLDKMPEKKQKRAIPTPEAMAKVFMVAGQERPFLLTLYYTLARVDEILRLRWDDVNLGNRTITLWTKKRRSGEYEPDTLPMSEGLYEVLIGLWRKRGHPEWVFFNPRTGTRYMHRPKLMRGLCRQAGVTYFGFHAIRHYAASYLADKEKISMVQVSRLLRHTNLRTTELYLQVLEPGAKEAIGKLPDPSDFNKPTHQPYSPLIKLRN